MNEPSNLKMTMETVNGKLLGDVDGDSDRLQREFHSFNREIDGVKQYLQQLEQRYKKLEVLVDVKQRQQIQAYRDELKSIQLPVRQIAVRLAELEKNKLSRIETNLNSLEQQIPKRIFWLGFYSSLVCSFISLWNWFELHPLDNQVQSQQISMHKQVVKYYSFDDFSNSKIC